MFDFNFSPITSKLIIPLILSHGLFFSACSKSSPPPNLTPSKPYYNQNGFDSSGIHRDTGTRYNPNGYDRNGIDQFGYDADGYNAITGLNRLGQSRNHNGNSSNRNLITPLSIEDRRAQIINTRNQNVQAYLRLVAPPQTPFTLPAQASREQLAQLVMDTLPRFLSFQPNFEQIIELITQNAGGSQREQDMILQIKNAAIWNENLYPTSHHYVRLMQLELPGIIHNLPHYRQRNTNLILETLPYILDRFATDTDPQLAALENFIRTIVFPDTEEGNILQVQLGEDFQNLRQRRPQAIRERVIAHLKDQIRALMATQQEAVAQDPLFRYYLITPPDHLREPHAGSACQRCGEACGANNQGIICQTEGCEVALHRGIDLFDFTLNELNEHAGNQPVTCGEHELYLSDASWDEMRNALPAEIGRLDENLREAQRRGNLPAGLAAHWDYLNPNSPYAPVAQRLTEVRAHIQALNDAETTLAFSAGEYGLLMQHVMNEMINPSQNERDQGRMRGSIIYPGSADFDAFFQRVRRAFADSAFNQRARVIPQNHPQRTTLEQNRQITLSTPFLAPVNHEHVPSPLILGTLIDSPTAADRANVSDIIHTYWTLQHIFDPQRNPDPGAAPDAPEDGYTQTQFRYFKIAQHRLAIKQALDPLKEEEQLLSVRENHQKRVEQHRDFERIKQRWELQTLIAYYRHLHPNGSERAEENRENPPYRFCGNPECNRLITRGEVQNGHYSCPTCHRETCFSCDHHHPGRSCAQFEADRAGDTAMQALLHDPASNIRPCPYCLVPTHRTEACYHMDCPNCGSRWNWQFGRLRQRSIETTWGDGRPEPGPPRGYRVRGDAGYQENTGMESAFPPGEGNVTRVLRGHPRGEVPGYNPALQGGYVTEGVNGGFRR
jgi:hypothetical protein